MNIIISESIDHGIQDYLDFRFKPESSEFNSFNVIIIRLLILIYGEDSIINPYLIKSKNEFDKVLTQYGYELDRMVDFLNQVDEAYELDSVKKLNTFFISIQKNLIDMFMLKKAKTNMPQSDTNKFYDLLYTQNNKNPIQISYNYLNARSIDEIDNYFKTELIKYSKVDATKPRVLLNPDAYQLVGINMEQVNNMTADYLETINHKIYLHFGINDNAINKDYLLEKRIEQEKNKRDSVSSGNGYIDILLVLGIIATIVLGVLIIYLIIRN